MLNFHTFNDSSKQIFVQIGLIYWTDTGERKIKRANKEGKENETIIGRGLHTADGIAIDSAGRKVFCVFKCFNLIAIAICFTHF